MKKIKKIFALLMTVAMVMGLSVTAFAAETTNVTITVDNAENAEVKYLQIVEADTTSTLGWKYVDTYADDFEDVAVDNLIEIAKEEKSENKFATSDSINNTQEYEASELAEILETFKTKVLADGKKVTSNTFQVTAGGLYVLVPLKNDYTYSPTLVYVPVNSNSTTPIEVDVKGAPNTPEKELVNVTEGKIEDNTKGDIVDNDRTVTANDQVEYRVTITYPYFSDGAKNKTFKITDTLENGTYVGDSLSVKVNNIAYNNYKLEDSKGFEILSIGGREDFVLNFNYDSTMAGREVEITYTVNVNDDISDTNLLKNTVKSTIGTEENQKIIISDTVKVVFDKVDATDNTLKLDGAVFALYEGTTDDTETATLLALYADFPAGTDLSSIELPEDYEQYRNRLKLNDTTLATGRFTINNLDANKSYYIKEIVAPNGYKVVDTEYQLIPGGEATGYPKLNQEMTIDNVRTLKDEYQYNDFTVKMTDESQEGIITNTTLSKLPSTGGIGTTIFTIGGCVIMIAAAGLFFATRKKAEK